MLTADFIATAITVPAIAAASWFTTAQISRLSEVMNKGFDDMEGIIRSGPDMPIAETTRTMQGELSGMEELLRAESARTQARLDAIIERLRALNGRLTALEERSR